MAKYFIILFAVVAVSLATPVAQIGYNHYNPYDRYSQVYPQRYPGGYNRNPLQDGYWPQEASWPQQSFSDAHAFASASAGSGGRFARHVRAPGVLYFQQSRGRYVIPWQQTAANSAEASANRGRYFSHFSDKSATRAAGQDGVSTGTRVARSASPYYGYSPYQGYLTPSFIRPSFPRYSANAAAEASANSGRYGFGGSVAQASARAHASAGNLGRFW